MSLVRIEAPNAPQAAGPYSQGMAVPVLGLVFTAGQIAIDPSTGTLDAAADATTQAERVLLNLRAVLEGAGSSLDRVIKTTVFLTSLDDFAAMNAVYARHFGDHKPARSTIQVAALPLGARVEIEAVALTAQ